MPDEFRYQVTPVGDQVLLLHDKPRRTTMGGIALPDSAEIPVLTARVLAVSESLDDNFKYPFGAGDLVVYNCRSGVPIDMDPADRRYLVPADAVLAIVRDTRPHQER
jgi:chaperonin GroES